MIEWNVKLEFVFLQTKHMTFLIFISEFQVLNTTQLLID